MKRLVRCDYRDLHNGETWSRFFWFDAQTGQRTDPTVVEIENAPLPDRKRPFWRGVSR